MDPRRRQFLLYKQNANIHLLPWILNDTQFYEQCVRCNACLKVCETNIIEKNLHGFPVVNLNKGECTFCYACAQACELPLFENKNKQPWDHIVTIDSSCLSLRKIECRSCNEVCDEQAITFTQEIGGYKISLHKNKCTGCGACISTCPINAIKTSVNE